MARHRAVDPDRFAAVLGAWLSDNHHSQAEAAERLGVAQSRISTWLAGSAAPGKSTAERILPTMGLALADVAPLPDDGTTPALLAAHDVVLIPRTGTGGTGALGLPESGLDADPYPAAELRRLTGRDPKDFLQLTIIGDSMAPRLRAGDNVIYIPCNEILDHGLYVLDLDGGRIVKQVQRLGGNVLMLIPVNPDYVRETFVPVEEDGVDSNLYRSDVSHRTATLGVVGKVLWYPTLA